jgi:hypothetical protein
MTSLDSTSNNIATYLVIVTKKNITQDNLSSVYKFIISICEVYSNIHKPVLCSVTKYFAWRLDKQTGYLKKCFSFSFEVLGCQLENVEMDRIKLSISCFRHHSE